MKALLAGIAAARGAVDRALGRFTTLFVVATALWAIVVIALIESLFGITSFDPLAGVLCVVLAVATTVGGALLGGWLFRSPPELESPFISGALVFLVFTPSFEAPDLIAIGLAGAIAGLSRYVFALRGRHLFNPAAIGVFLVSLVGGIIDLTGAPSLAPPSWWVATPPLLIPVALGAIIVAYRSSVFTVVLAYVLIAGGIRTGQYLAFGADLGQALGLVLGSAPIVFAAGFMLSEPQTLPPRWWQRLIVAAVAALLASIPFSLGPFYSSPELGLVAGNLVALMMVLPRTIRLTVLESRRHGASTVELRLAVDEQVKHLPGQAIELVVPNRPRDLRGRRRVLSIASAPGEDVLRVAFTVPPRASTAKTALAGLQHGDVLTASRVFGDFTAPRPGTAAVLVAGGIGITPFLSMLRAEPDADVVLVYRSGDETPPFLPELAQLGIRVVLSSPVMPEPLPDGWTWLGPGRLVAADLERVIPDLPGRTAYVSGPPGMVAQLTADLRRLGVRRVRKDVFSGA